MDESFTFKYKPSTYNVKVQPTIIFLVLREDNQGFMGACNTHEDACRLAEVVRIPTIIVPYQVIVF
jgi:hypothetical protein